MGWLSDQWHRFVQSQVWQSFFGQFQWLDWAVFAVILIGIVHGMKRGFWDMVFKMLGMVAVIFFSIAASDTVNQFLLQYVKFLPAHYAPMLAFLVTTAALWYLSVLMMRFISGLFKVKTSLLSNVLGGVLGGFYAFLIASLFAQVLVLSPWSNWEKVFSEQGIFVGQSLRDAAPAIYHALDFSFAEKISS